ncbi:MAG: helix-turn-helix domain-containing protein [Bacteroidota bacterium]
MRKLNSTNYENHNAITAECPILSTLHFVSGRWKLVILWRIKDEVGRFGTLQKSMPGISKKMLSQQLRELERDGFIHREIFAEMPPRVEYSLTELGRSFIPVLEHIEKWGNEQNITSHFQEMIEKIG